MLKHNKMLFYLCLILTLVLPSSIFSMDDDDDDPYKRYAPINIGTVDDRDQPDAQRSLKLISAPGAPSSDAILEDKDATIMEQLKKYFNPTVLNVRVSNTFKQCAGGVTAVLGAFPSFQVPVPLFYGAAGEIGLTEARFPFLQTVFFVSLIPVITGAIATYDAIANALTYRSPEFIEAQESVTARPYSRLERWVYSPVNKMAQLLFWGGLMAAIITDLESDLTGWGPWYIWAVCFSVLFLLPEYAMNVSSNNNPNDHPYRHYESPEAKRTHQSLVTMVTEVKEEVRDNGLKNTTHLTTHMNVLFSPPSSQPNDTTPLISARAPATLVMGEGEDTERNIDGMGRFRGRDDENITAAPVRNSAQQRLAEEAWNDLPREKKRSEELSTRLGEPRYIQVFDEKIKIYNTLIPEERKAWNKGKKLAALWLSNTVQVLGFPLRNMITFDLSRKILNSFLPQKYALGGGVVATILLLVPNAMGAYKEIPLTMTEFREFLRLYPPNSPQYWGARIVSLIAIGGTVAYILLPVGYYIRHNILEGGFGITNLAAQLCLTLPFFAGTLYAGARQFIGKQLFTIANWASIGMDIDFCCKCRTCKCCDARNELTRGQELLRKVDEMVEKVVNLNSEAANALSRATGLYERNRE